MWKRMFIVAFLLFLVLLTFLPRLLSLSAHWSSDESLWMSRSRTFILALEQGRFADTFITHHPGVTTTWLGGLAIQNAAGQKSISTLFAQAKHFFIPEMLAHLRFPIAALSGILILIIGLLSYRLFCASLAAVGTLFLAIEPFLLAESRRVHTDALTSEFLFLTLLLWLCYLEGETQRRRALVFSGICFGLACLTKSHAGAFLLFLPFLLFWYVKQRRLSGAKMLMSTIFFCAVALLTTLIVWPYLWAVTFGNRLIWPLLFIGCLGLLFWSGRKLARDYSEFSPAEFVILGCGLLLIVGISLATASYVLEGMYEAFTEAHELPKRFLGEIRYNPGPFYYLVMGFFWSAPLAVPLTFLALYGAWQQRHLNKKTFRITVVLLLFVIFYTAGLSLVAKKIARYLVICLPAMSVLSAMGVTYLIQVISKKYLHFPFLIVVVVLQVLPILKLHPYYATYHFPLLPGGWIAKNISVGGGVGLDVAADYLNAKPNSPQLQVRLSRFSNNLKRYFVGKTWRRSNSETLPRNINFDYDVEYVRGRQIQGTAIDSHPETGTPSSALQLQRDIPRELEYVVRLNGIDYVWIYRVLNTYPDDAPPTTQ